jgi:hypothetical protein
MKTTLEKWHPQKQVKSKTKNQNHILKENDINIQNIIYKRDENKYITHQTKFKYKYENTSHTKLQFVC